MGERIIAHIRPGDPEVEQWARRYLRAGRARARILRLDLPARPWTVQIPGERGIYRFTYWQDAIQFADERMRK